MEASSKKSTEKIKKLALRCMATNEQEINEAVFMVDALSNF